MENLKMYCVTNKEVNFLDKTSYNIGWVGLDVPPANYITCNHQDNIFFKEQFYSELTFHYWYWKNKLILNDPNWIGFCQKRRFWIKKESLNKNVDNSNYLDHFLDGASEEWNNYESIICNPINVNKVKKIKMLKRGFKSLARDPLIFFDEKKQSLKFHFDMHHGYGNLSKAANLLEKNDREEFLHYINHSTNYNPHIMFIAKSNIVNQWFNALFPWLFRCEKIFGFKNLKGYDTQRLYAYLAERYLSFWFNKHTKSLNWPWLRYNPN